VLVPSGFEQGLLELPEGDGRERFACGVGPVAAGIEAARLLARRRPDHCWLVGLAGTRDPARAPVGAVVLGEAVRNEAVGAGWGEGFVDLGGMGLDGDGAGQPDLLALALPGEAARARAVAALAALPAGAGPRPVLAVGVVGTVAAASGDAAAAAQWAARHPDVLVEEMEGWAVALACHRAGVPLSLVRAVGNVCGDRHLPGWRTVEAMVALDAVLAALLLAPGADEGTPPDDAAEDATSGQPVRGDASPDRSP
jgi:futalosine hydrolase